MSPHSSISALFIDDYFSEYLNRSKRRERNQQCYVKKLILRILKEYNLIIMHAVTYNTVSYGHPTTSALTSPTLIQYATFSNTL
jgi:hypothetical protein